MKSEDSSNVSPSKTPMARSHADTVTDSRPPMPKHVAEGQPSPEEYGQKSYTSRQPWVSQDEPVVHDQGSNSGFVVDGSTLSPFGEKTVEPTQTAANEIALEGVDETGDAPEIEAVPTPVIRRRSRGNGVFFSLFILFAKAVPLILAMGGGYYTYSYYFGPIPMVDQVWRKSAALVGIKAPPPPEKSKASRILQQTRDVVNANDQRVNFASALADQDVDLNALSTPQEMLAPAPKASPTPTSTTVISVESSPAKGREGPGLAQLAGNLAETIKSKLASDSDESPEVGAEEPKASSEFIRWVNRANISGVRRGANPKIFINDLPVNPGDIIYHPLRITVVGIDPNDTYLIFQDKTGATYRRRY